MFLSPPWGGVKYKDSVIYKIRELMTPNIVDIVRVSLNLAKNIIFYLPRTLLLDDLLDILYTVQTEQKLMIDHVFLDVHILKSANKIKALMIIFGPDCNSEVTQNNLKDYLNYAYEFESAKVQTLLNIAKVIGNFKFFQTENSLKKQYTKLPYDFDSVLINYFTAKVLTSTQLVRLKTLEKKETKTAGSISSLETLINSTAKTTKTTKFIVTNRNPKKK